MTYTSAKYRAVEDRKERVYNKDENPANDTGLNEQDSGNDGIDYHGNDKPDEENDIRQPSNGPDCLKDR